ncbi:MAG: tRNA pseudouridine(38-40) synthase TruA [Chloroflexi bacterium]|nr:tRNA pseudouridine(38-40) synthase TruA [Chloroflexota bacterium]
MHVSIRNIAFVLEYDGTAYHGFQVQPGLSTIQAEIERALLSVTQEELRVAAAGRTDAGVHACGQVVSTRISASLPCDTLQRALNAVLPDDIVVRRCYEVAPTFHARYSAKSRRYRYTILNRPEPTALARSYVYHFGRSLDLQAMQEASDLLVGTHDFASFARVHANAVNTVRTVLSAEWRQKKRWTFFDLEANGFLPQMVRGIVGTLIWVGTGKVDVERFGKILEACDRRLAGPTAPARGLCFMEARY